MFTIGYEGKTIDEFLVQLRGAGVSLLIDVRAVAASRRPGFSKTALAAALRECGISYLHLRALGTPKAGREAARKGRVAEMRAIYSAQLETLEAQIALDEVRSAASQTPSTLLCFEAAAASCHRAVIAERLAASDEFEVVDL